MSEPVITNSMIHYGFPRVWVEEYETTDRHGDRCIVNAFLLNGSFAGDIFAYRESSGFKFKKNGERMNRFFADLGAAMPANVRARLTELQAELDARKAAV